MAEAAEPAPAAIERKLVTTLFCDVVGSTALGERLDPEVLQGVQHAYFDRMTEAIESSGGTVEKFVGDAVVAVFGVPRLHEDDAARAVRCAFAMREALLGLNDDLRSRAGVELELRIGIATGEAVAGPTMHALATGDVMNAAARLQQAAVAGEILVGRETRGLTREVVDFAEMRLVQAKGKTVALEAWPALAPARERRRNRAALVGRERELGQLAGALDRTIGSGEAQVVAVLGDPGIGKSRLAEEFAARMTGGARVLASACLPPGEGTTWRPFAQIVAADAGVTAGAAEDVALERLARRLSERHELDEAQLLEAQLAPLVGAARTSGSGSELLWALRRYLEGLASELPSVLIFDDLHWAPPELLELVAELVETIAPVPLLFVYQGRPEVRERLAPLLTGRHAETIRLEALSSDEAFSLAAALAPPGTSVGNDVLARAEGNPLFLEELVAIAAEGADADHATLPYSVRALIAARLDLLDEPAKAVVQTAAVVGDVFWDQLVAELRPELVASLSSALRALRTRGLVEEEQCGSFPGARQFRFHHALIREAAYESLTKRERARLHRRAGEWFGVRAEESPQLLPSAAHHHDAAMRLELEVAPLDRPALEDVEVTVGALLRAGEWSMLNAAVQETIRLLQRAVEVAAGDEALEAAARAELAAVLARAGRTDEAVAAAEAVLAGEPAPAAAAYASLALAEVARDRGLTESIAKHGARAISEAARAGLPKVEAEALHVLFWGEFWAGRFSEGDAVGLRSASLAESAGDLGLAARPLAWVGASKMWRGDVTAGEELALRAMGMARRSGSPSAIATCHAVIGHIRRVQDRLAEALDHGLERVRITREIGERFHVASGLTLSVAEPLFDAGDLTRAWDALEEALAIAQELRSASLEGPARVRRARIHVALGRLDEAAAELGALKPGKGTGEDDHAAATAELFAARGEDAEANLLWREVLARLPLAQRLDRAELALPYARFLVDRGRAAEAGRVLDDVDTLVEGTGAVLFVRQVRELRERL